MDISVEPPKSLIFIRQRWLYKWLLDSPTVNEWTPTEKRLFHTKFDQLIWQIWSRKYTVRVKGTSKFANRYRDLSFVVSIDVQWVITNPHWTVMLNKLPPTKSFNQSYVNWQKRIIALDTKDAVPVNKSAHLPKVKQYGLTHEFGHALGNVPGVIPKAHSDEYLANNKFLQDERSIMNVGNELRKRHFDFVLQELNSIQPGTIFYLF